MATYVNIYDMQDNASFRKQVITAARIASVDILNESDQTPNHTIRLAWATSVLGYDTVNNANVIQRLISAVSGNATLQAAAPAGPWVDGDIQFVVNSLIDVQANNS